MKKVLTIAGTDCSGGAGMSADFKTITAHKMYAEGVVTAVTAQNTMGVRSVCELDARLVGQQLDCVFEDIFPDAVKIGMVYDEAIINITADRLSYYKAQNIVIDPVMISTSGRRLLRDSAARALTEKLFPLALLITPNIPEAETLSGIKISSEADLLDCARKIHSFYKGNILIKGGHAINGCDDFLYKSTGETCWFRSSRIDNPNTHGTGCTLSSAIACGLADSKSLEESIKSSKKYLSGALSSMLDLGKGNGPLDHCFCI
ncbi:MAG: bifunctional hydroxymethylpyrimidine kinase/phosphomethylpyrimidine kinase [Oscillospiraceae bacterium]|nr:bifunctional hydroxymethylpyrimidine kinase/phosphomethylpyrimidine kinase [Oscillospiraceae bacterium]